MNWQLIHDQIIERAKTRCLEGYYESHHIIPKCLGGTDSSDNLVSLTAKEHFIIHKILCILFPNENGLSYAAFMMANTKGKNRHYHISSSEYQRLKENYSKALSKNMKGKTPWNKGIPRTPETKKKMSESLKGRAPSFKGKKHSAESIEKMRNANTGNNYRLGTTHSDETKRKISEKAKGRPSPRKGKTLSDETKLKLSIAARNRKLKNS